MQELNEFMDFVKTLKTNLIVLSYTAKWKYDSATNDKVNSLRIFNGGFYPMIPINSFRNVLADFSNTQFIFHMDIDFVPSMHLYLNAKHLIAEMNCLDRSAIIVPHWQIRSCTKSKKYGERYGNNVEIPGNFIELKRGVENQTYSLFHSSCYDLSAFHNFKSSKTPEGCENTNEKRPNYPNVRLSENDRWFYDSLDLVPLNEISAVQVSPLKISSNQDLNRWEPFLIINQMKAFPQVFQLEKSEKRLIKDIPRWNEIFFGRHRNKISYVAMLRLLEHQFFYIVGEFIIHVHHAHSIYRLQNKQKHNQLMDAAFIAQISQIKKETLTSSKRSKAIFEKLDTEHRMYKFLASKLKHLNKAKSFDTLKEIKQ
jgi:hypothetical protein